MPPLNDYDKALISVSVAFYKLQDAVLDRLPENIIKDARSKYEKAKTAASKLEHLKWTQSHYTAANGYRRIETA